ncbi:MAG: sigma 54-interacting transcriptional regulator [Salinisphaera sp.]|nr:sigma 54-interacting transcriptional regulator [Salinisphaera sp.]
MAKRRGNILLVYDDSGLVRLLSLRLESLGFRVDGADSGEAALGKIESERPDVVISDVRMQPMDGLELLHRIHVRMPGLPVLLLTAHGNIPDAIAATRNGACGFLTKPVDDDALLRELDQALALHKVGANGSQAAGGLVTRSTEMLELLAEAQMVGDSEASVLVRGDSGTGKELLARFIHDNSRRAQAPFVAVNCSAIPETLLESELFGHVKGAFTGATREHPGLFRSAEGGTIFLDEIGDMPAMLQVKLLRVLEERQIRPVGGSREVAVDVRVVSATHRDLREQIDAGAVREALYSRRNVITLRLAPLSERREDIPLLAEHFLQQIAEREGAKPKTYSPQAMAELVTGDWPGNVRQLQNVVEHNVALSTAKVISLRQVRRAMGQMRKTMLTYADARADFSRTYLTQLLRISDGNVSAAARMAGRNRTDFYKLLARHELEAGDFK